VGADEIVLNLDPVLAEMRWLVHEAPWLPNGFDAVLLTAPDAES
jgi:hypothetical protein